MNEIPVLLEDYRQAARNALTAGFDGAQIHSANGYLLDQFLRDSTNLRTDAYGGPAENRVRLLLEVTQAVAGVVVADRTSVRISPKEDRRGVRDSDPHHLFATAAAGLSKLGIAFLDVREPGAEGIFSQAQHPPVAPAVRHAFAGPLVLNSDYGHDSAQHALDTGAADAIGFGRPFISNPDLPYRLAEGHQAGSRRHGDLVHPGSGGLCGLSAGRPWRSPLRRIVAARMKRARAGPPLVGGPHIRPSPARF